MYQSHVIVVLDGDVPVAFAAFKPTAGQVRVVHELWVSAFAPSRRALVTRALSNALEASAITAGCSRLCVVVGAFSPLHLMLRQVGYRVIPSGADRMWFEKRLNGGGDPLEAA